MNGDNELLRRYVEERSETAFAELVRSHLNLVYFAALRQLGGDAHRAGDVAQAVFTDLACKAPSLTGRATLAGWLHTSTRFAAAKARRAEFSRRHYEQEATTMNALLSDPDPATEWERLRPMIDGVIHELDDRDREAVLLRYFENRPFAEIGAALRLSEDAARMRIDRALEKLRAALARRGVKSTGAALAFAFANLASATVPAGLATSITGAALAGVGVGGLVTGGIFMSMKTTAMVGAVALAALVATFSQWSRAFRAESELATLTVDRDDLRTQLRAEQERSKRSAQGVAALESEVALLKSKQAGPSSGTNTASVTDRTRQKEFVIERVTANLRQIAASIDRFKLEYGRAPASLDELVGEDKFIKRLISVAGESYSTLAMTTDQPLVVTTPEGITVTFNRPAPSGPRMLSLAERFVGRPNNQIKLSPSARKALEAYRAANNGKGPANIEAIIPYFATSQEGADFVELIEAQKAANK